MSKEAPIFIYATEMVSTYYSILKIKNKRVLTVCGSGDQVLNAYFLGAKQVVGFDINKRSEFILRLKIAAINELNYEEFLQFFGSNKLNTQFDYDLYKKIRVGLDRKTARFFDKLYRDFNFNNKKLLKSNNFRQRDELVRNRIKLINAYLKDRKSYLNLRYILKSVKFKFVQSDIKDIYLHKELQRSAFDIVNMSNVPSSITRGRSEQGDNNPCKYLVKDIIENIFKLVSPQGVCFYSVISPSIYPNPSLERPPSSKISNVKGFYKDLNIYEIKYCGILPNTFDKIIIFKNKVR
jgi:16S rRNA G966 N2-methylase RsmD